MIQSFIFGTSMFNIFTSMSYVTFDTLIKILGAYRASHPITFLMLSRPFSQVGNGAFSDQGKEDYPSHLKEQSKAKSKMRSMELITLKYIT